MVLMLTVWCGGSELTRQRLALCGDMVSNGVRTETELECILI